MNRFIQLEHKHKTGIQLKIGYKFLQLNELWFSFICYEISMSFYHLDQAFIQFLVSLEKSVRKNDH